MGTVVALGPVGGVPLLPSIYGNINYLTGQYVVNFDIAEFTFPPAANQKINAQTVQYQASRSTSILFYEDTFTLRPIPDQSYAVNMEAYIQPIELVFGTDNPQYKEWFQYISYGAAKKIFEDRSDSESVQQIMEEFKTQEILINRRTIVQQSSERSPSIYAPQPGLDMGFPSWGFWPNG